jgi:hypothetical protein
MIRDIVLSTHNLYSRKARKKTRKRKSFMYTGFKIRTQSFKSAFAYGLKLKILNKFQNMLFEHRVH